VSRTDTAAVQELVGLFDAADPYAFSDTYLDPLQLQAIDDRFQQRRTQLPVLAQRASDSGVDRVTALQDVLPLLFPHSLYKSYPEAFVTQGRWDRMNQWLGTLSTQSMDGIDLDGITDIDDWLSRLHAAGHLVYSSSGTSGKCALLPSTAEDFDFAAKTWREFFRWAFGTEAKQDLPAFILLPSRGAHVFVPTMNRLGQDVGRPGQVHFLSDLPSTAAEGNRLGSLRRAIAEGRATPTEIAALETFGAERQQEMGDRLIELVDHLVEHRHEPIFMLALYQQMFQIMQELRARGIEDAFHPDSAILTGGGRKADNTMPPDYREQVRAFLAPVRLVELYGMSELTAHCPPCPQDAWHVPPTVALLVLDKTGEQLLNPARGEGGVVEGRMAFVDVAVEGRWGGLITGDNITANFSACGCGRPGPTVTSIVRYSDLPEGDDKLTCAGSMDAYVRGVIE